MSSEVGKRKEHPQELSIDVSKANSKKDKKGAAEQKEEEAFPEFPSPTPPKHIKRYRGELPAIVGPGSFSAEQHFYPRVLNANLHPLVASFMGLSHERMATRYCHMHPTTNYHALLKWLKYQCKHFRWSGSDLFTVTNSEGFRQVIVIETNSCPSGQKSMPYTSDDNEAFGYNALLANTLVPQIKEMDAAGKLPKGALAVLYDKNEMETSGYAATLADIMHEKVYLVKYFDNELDSSVKWEDGVLHIRTRMKPNPEEWTPVRACFKYVTQKPWNRFPLVTRTVILNPIVACIAGGRNKAMAAKAYDFFNADLVPDGLGIRVPETIKDVSKNEIPLWVKSMGGHAVVKIPYSNAGQGVFTITSPEELKEFMATKEGYEKFIVQSLVGNSSWSSVSRQGKFYHVGTVPNKKNEIFVCDLRMMICSTAKGFNPLAVYARRAHMPLAHKLDDSNKTDSWSMLGTNLSVKESNGAWNTETNRLMLMDNRDFNKLGIGIDDLIDAFVQSVLSTIAIDKLCERILKGGQFQRELFFSLNADSVLMDELALAAPGAASSSSSSASK